MLSKKNDIYCVGLFGFWFFLSLHGVWSVYIIFICIGKFPEAPRVGEVLPKFFLKFRELEKFLKRKFLEIINYLKTLYMKMFKTYNIK